MKSPQTKQKDQIINGYNLSALPNIPKNFESTKDVSFKDFFKALTFVFKTSVKTAPFWITLFTLSIVIQVIAPIASAFLLKQIIDQLIDGAIINQLYLPVTYLVIASFLAATVTKLRQYARTKISYSLAHFHIDTVLNHIADLPATLFYQPEIQTKLIRISIYEVALTQFIQIIGELITKPLIIVTNLFILWTFSPWFVLAIIVIMIVNSTITIKHENAATSVNFINSGYSAIAFVYNKFFDESRIEELKVFRLKKFILARLKQVQNIFEKEQSKHLIIKLSFQSIISLFWALTKFGSIILMVQGYIAGALTIGDVTFYNSIIWKLESNSSLFSYNMANLQRFTIYILDMIDLLEQDSESDNSQRKVEQITFDTIALKDVDFTYPGSTSPIFTKLNLEIKSGEKVAIVGRNGAGKTTLVNLLLNLYPPTNGDILIQKANNEINFKNLSIDDWRYSINYVPQDFSKLPFSLHENVAYGEIEEFENKEKILDSLDKADLLEDLLKKIPHNKPEDILNVYLGKKFENSHKLSGGQYQKLAIARAFMNTNAPLAIFDEPSSKLDAEAEEKLFTRLIKETGDKTVLFISHRYSTVRDADRILVIENGKVSEDGSHEELMKLDGYYAEMFKLQAGKYL